MSQETDRHALPARIAFGTIFIKEIEKLTDEWMVAPTDSKYPTGIGSLNQGMQYLETAVDLLWDNSHRIGHNALQLQVCSKTLSQPDSSQEADSQQVTQSHW